VEGQGAVIELKLLNFHKHKLVYSNSEDKEQIDIEKNRFIVQHTLSKPELIQISIEIKQRNFLEPDKLFLQEL